jgi:hypothetical protein
MSNLYDTANSNSETEKEAAEKLEPLAKPNSWSVIQNDLAEAFSAWEELEKSSANLSPEEEQFLQIKTIIEHLKSKLEQF